MPYPSTDLADLANQLLGTKGATDLTFSGLASQNIASITGSELLSNPLIGTFFWQCYMHTQEFRHFLDKAKLPINSIRKTFVVRHGAPDTEPWTRFDLILMSDSISDPDHYISGDAVAPASELRMGWMNFLKSLGASVVSAHEEKMRLFDPAQVAIEASQTQPFGVILLKLPELVGTASLPPHPIEINPSSNLSTGGIIAQHSTGNYGVTAALHSVKANPGDKVEVDGQVGTVKSVDILSDSVFVEAPQVAKLKGKPVSVLSGMLPRQYEKVSFTGAKSGHQIGDVHCWSPQLPWVSGNTQLVITTGPITKPGDSGAALLDSSGNVLGFAHERTGFGVPNPFSSWIWAESVLMSHNLQ
jgi:hypothetical protein